MHVAISQTASTSPRMAWACARGLSIANQRFLELFFL